MVMSAYTNHGKITSAKKINVDRRRSSYIERIVSKIRNTAAQMTAELNIHLEDTVSTKTVRHEPHKSSIHRRAAVVKPLITESNAQMRKRWCQSDNWTHMLW
jgi:hypothetical protein